jgi:hypothetical protein
LRLSPLRFIRSAPEKSRWTSRQSAMRLAFTRDQRVAQLAPLVE